MRGLEIHITKLASSWSNNLNSQPAARLPESVQPRARVRRPEVWWCTRRGTCPGVADERVGNLAVAEANSKRAIRMPFYSVFETIVRLTYPQKRIAFTKTTANLLADSFGENNGEHIGGPCAMKAPLRKVKSWVPDTVTSVAFFFFCMRTPRRTCVHVRKECSLEISVTLDSL